MVYSHTSYSNSYFARYISTDAGLHKHTYNPEGLRIGKQYSPASEDDQKFTGHFWEQECGLGIYHTQARMYDPATGRFLGVDAMRGEMPGWNPYHYMFNNPVRYVDSDGNMPAAPVVWWGATKLYAATVAKTTLITTTAVTAGHTGYRAYEEFGSDLSLSLDRSGSSLSTSMELQWTPDGEVNLVPDSNVAPTDNLSAGTIAPSGSTAFEQYIQNGNGADPNIGKTTGSGGQIPDNSGWKGRLSRGY